MDPYLGEAKVYGVKFTLESDPSVYQYSMPFQISSSAKAFDTGHKGAEGKIAVPAVGSKFKHAAFISPPPSDSFRKLNLTGERLSTNRNLFRKPSNLPSSGYELPEPASGPGGTTATTPSPAPSTGAGLHVLPNLIVVSAAVTDLLLQSYFYRSVHGGCSLLGC